LRVAHCCYEHADQSFGSLTEAPGQPASIVPASVGGAVVNGGMLEIDAEAGEEQLVERVAAIDVAKASAVVCVRVGHASIAGRRVTRVWEVRSTTNAIIALAEQLERIERVVVESTSDYWRPFLYLLEAQGLMVWLVNASQVKQVPGRPKTDKLDAVWLAKLNERGMLRPSFVPPAEIRRLRDYTRLRVDLIADRTRQVQRLEKLLEDALIKLSTVASDIMGVSGRAMLDALIAGERDPNALAELARGRMRGKRAALVEALTGRFDDHHAELTQMLLDEIDALTLKAETLTLRIDQLIAEIPAHTRPRPPRILAATRTIRAPDRCRSSRVSTRSPGSAPTPRTSSSPRSDST
jgi:transposase